MRGYFVLAKLKANRKTEEVFLVLVFPPVWSGLWHNQPHEALECVITGMSTGLWLNFLHKLLRFAIVSIVSWPLVKPALL